MGIVYSGGMSDPAIITHNLGYPRIGAKRELKKATEAFWAGQSTAEELEEVGRQLRAENWRKQAAAGIDLLPGNDFSFYDQMLDTLCMVGAIPGRFGWSGGEVDLDTRFLIARGKRAGGSTEDDDTSCGCGHVGESTACEMTKWFDTNYHYLVPEFDEATRFRLSSRKVIGEFREALDLGFRTKPVLIGPVTFLTLGKTSGRGAGNFDCFVLLEELLAVYAQVLGELQEAGAEWVQIDEPVLSLDLSAEQQGALERSCRALKAAAPKLKILLASYFGDLRENLDLACRLECDAFHLDAVRARTEVEKVARRLPPERVLSVGIVDGRNVWKNNYAASLETIRRVREIRHGRPLMLAPSCSLLHAPVTLESEGQLDPEIGRWLAFADQKLTEVVELAGLATGSLPEEVLGRNREDLRSRRLSKRIHEDAVKNRADAVTEADMRRISAYPERRAIQREKLGLPLFPTTTIGSFPQTAEIRAARAQWKKGRLSEADYEAFLEEETRRCIRFQEDTGLDVLVHGEFERNDMVEYFGEQLEGFAFTRFGWVQSYGSRYVKPPIIFGDVSRPKPMRVGWSTFARSLTERPVKGMLTGPITILQWSFVRDDQPLSATARQIALAIRDEVADLESAGLSVIQIDEAALREGLPLRRADWNDYLGWAVESFRLTSSVVRDETQIHTHMCYSEFNDIIDSIAALDADVITIETSRSRMDLLDAFVGFNYPNEIGPGVYDIHSPRVPTVAEMEALITRAAEVLPVENLWVNPDCGLKTRGWKEVKPAIAGLVQAAKGLRERFAPNYSSGEGLHAGEFGR